MFKIVLFARVIRENNLWVGRGGPSEPDTIEVS